MAYTVIADKSMDMTEKSLIGTYYALLVGNLYLMSAKYTFVCTMNFRYLMPTVFIGSLFMGMAAKKKPSVQIIFLVSAVIFALLSVLVYISAVSDS